MKSYENALSTISLGVHRRMHEEDICNRVLQNDILKYPIVNIQLFSDSELLDKI